MDSILTFAQETLLKKRAQDKFTKMCAVAYHKSHVLAIGFSGAIDYFKIYGKKHNVPSRHAEITVISNLINNIGRTKRSKILHVDLIVVRYGNGGICNCSKPCHHCIEFMKKLIYGSNVRIELISYYNKHNKLKTKKISNIHNEHVSAGWKIFYGEALE